MTTDISAAAARLAEVLEAENAALAGLDLARAACLLSEKEGALSHFVACCAAASQSGAPPAPGLHDLARRLGAASDENRRLLERAIATQSRVIAIVARAASRASVTEPARYGAYGRAVPGPGAGALAFCFRA